MSRRTIAFLLLIVSLAGVVGLSQGFRTVDTVGMLTCAVIAGCSLAEIAAGRKGPRRT